MKAYTVTWKKSATSRKVFTWTRFSDGIESAIESAKKAVDYETYGEGILLTVTAA